MDVKVPSAIEEACSIWNMAWKVSLATFCRIALGTIGTAFVGHLGKNELAAAALAGIWISGTQILVSGFSVSLCTLCGQAYGAKNFQLVGVWLQLGLAFVTVACIPVIISFFYVDKLLSWVNDDPEILALADTYARYSALSVWPQLAYSALRQYLQAQEIVTPATITAASSIVVSLLANYALIYGVLGFEGLGFIGSPLAQFVGSIYQLIALYLYACWWQRYHEKTWYGWTWEIFRLERIRSFLNLALGMSANMALDEWVYGAITAIAGVLGTSEIAANSVLFNLWGLLFAVFWGFGLPTQVRCANFLGANKPYLAKRTMLIGFILGGCSALVASIIVTIFAQPLALIFTTDPSIARLIQNTTPVFCTAVFVSALHLILAAVVEAMSLAMTLVLITGICSWAVILPCSYYFAIDLKFGLNGIWIGSICGETTKFLAIAYVLYRIDWKTMALLAVERSEFLDEAEMENDIMCRASASAASTPIMSIPSPNISRLTPRMVHHHRDQERQPILSQRTRSHENLHQVI